MQKKLLIVGAALILLLAAVAAVLPMLVNKNAIRDGVASAFKEVSGLDLEMQGEPVVHIFPLPHVTINDLYVANTPTATTSFLLSIKSLDVGLSPASIFSAHPLPQHLEASGVDLEIERLPTGEMNWRERVRATTSGGVYSASPFALLAIPSVSVRDCVAHFKDASEGIAAEYKDIAFSLSSNNAQGQGVTLSGKLRYMGLPIGVYADLGAVLSGVAPAKIQLSSSKSVLEYDGDAGMKNDSPYLKGSLKLDTDDAAVWISALMGDKQDATRTSYTALPVQGKGNVGLENGKLTLSSVALDGPIIKGDMQAALTGLTRMDIHAAIEKLDLEKFTDSRLPHVQLKDTAAASADYLANMGNTQKSYLDALEVVAQIQVADALYNGQHITDSTYSFDYANGDMTFSQAASTLPGASHVQFTGMGKSEPQGFTLEGQLDVIGNDFYEMLKVFKPKGFALPPQDFKRFRGEARLVASTTGVQLSDLRARIEGMGFIGGIVTNFGPRTQVRAALRIGGVNLDHFVALWGLEEWRQSFLNENLSPQKKEGVLANWLKELGYDFALNASLEKYTLGGNPYDQCEFRMSATQDRISFQSLKALYNGANISGSASLSVHESPPRVTVDLSADNIDLPTFLRVSPNAMGGKPILPDGHWSHEGFDFHWMELLNGTFHLHADQFKDGLWQAANADAQGSLESGKLQADTFSVDLLGAHTYGQVTLVGARIPTFSMVVKSAGVDVTKFAALFPVLGGMSGEYSIDINLNTSGIDSYSWASNLSGGAAMVARNVVLHDFDIDAITQAFAYVRSTSDILDTVLHAFPGGQTFFSNLQGQWEVRNGVFTTSNTQLTNPRSAGIYSGNVDIVNWKTQGQIAFDLRALDARHPPTLALLISGNLDHPEKKLDTHLLEQYVTNRASEGIINGTR